MMPIAKLAGLAPPVASAVAALARGEPVLIFDAVDRERETDLVFLSSMATPELVRLARQDAGGLICTAISNELRTRIGLPYFAELLELGEAHFPVLATVRGHRPRYDRRSAFGITLNHASTFTGVPDNDRARTIRALGELARDASSLSDAALQTRFAAEFSSPGHVPLLYAAPSLLRERKGHTELAISLARMGSLAESVTVCEMLGDSGGARSPEAARRFSAERGWSFLEGRTIAEEFDRWSA